MESSYLKSAIRQFTYYKKLAEGAMEQLTDEQLFLSPNEESNSVAVIVKHMAGNMLSRWTDFLTSDGEKTWRNRDMEFVDEFKNRQDLMAFWQKGWQCLFAAIEPLHEKQLQDIVYIRNEGHTVMEAINRQLCHYSYHAGQIVFLAKMLVNTGWKSLSIPRNASLDYNRKKFDQDKGIRHFTDNA